MNVIDRIKEEMKARGISQNKLAKAAQMSQSGLSSILSGAVSPKENTLQAIAAALDMPLSDLMRPPEIKKAPADAGDELRGRISRLSPANRDALSAYIDLLLISQASTAPAPGSPGSKP